MYIYKFIFILNYIFRKVDIKNSCNYLMYIDRDLLVYECLNVIFDEYDVCIVIW